MVAAAAAGVQRNACGSFAAIRRRGFTAQGGGGALARQLPLGRRRRPVVFPPHLRLAPPVEEIDEGVRVVQLSGVRKEELWPLILEKALAKYSGSCKIAILSRFVCCPPH